MPKDAKAIEDAIYLLASMKPEDVDAWLDGYTWTSLTQRSKCKTSFLGFVVRECANAVPFIDAQPKREAPDAA